MRLGKIILATFVGASSLLITAMVDSPTARAQSTTTGAIQGIVKDKVSGDPLAGVTVVVSSAGGGGTPTALTDDKGFYKVSDLMPGTYLVTFYYADITLERSGIGVGVNKTTPVYLTLDTNDAGGETIHVDATAPTIDPTSTSQGITLDQEYTKNIPVPGRTFDAALGAAAGSQGDGLGVSFSGSSSLENQYYVDGVNTTGLTYGTVGNPVINDFIQEIEVITGGYNAEYGRATGGVVNVVTKSGTNEIKGSVFGYITPGALIASATRTPRQTTSIEATANVAYQTDFGFEVGGPILKDKAWFYVGFGPALNKVNITRRINRNVDCHILMPDGTLSQMCDPTNNADGQPDVDPNTGFFITDTLDERKLSAQSTAYSLFGKVNFAVSPEHQGQISFVGQPSSGRNDGVYGLPQSTSIDFKQWTSDLSTKWTSKFNDNKTEVEAVVGWHRDSLSVDALDKSYNDKASEVLVYGDLGHWAGFGGETQGTKDGCADQGANDPYPLITNCPDIGVGYSVGGPGGLTRNLEQRYSAKLSVTERLKAAGSHEIKAGIDGEDNQLSKARLISGGAAYTDLLGNYQYVRVQRWVQLAGPDDMTNPRFDNTCRNGSDSFQCDFLSGVPHSPGTDIEGDTANWSAYVRDSWQIQPNLTLNAGLRYEEERLRYAKFLRNTTDRLTNRKLGKNAMTLQGMFAPRIGILYDWTKEGRSKIYTHWGRFYESIPLDINDRSFGGEVFYRQDFNTSSANGNINQCGPTDPNIGGPTGSGCLDPDPNQVAAKGEALIGSNGTLVEPGIKAQYLDELIFGLEYELIEDLKIGVAFQNRKLGRVIEDVSPDGANTYIIANPGEWSPSEESKLQLQIDQTDDAAEKARLMDQLNMFKGIKIFDKPRRDYNALQFTVTRRFSKALYLQGSYTYSRTEGNYPGLFSSNNGQVDPNISSQYDLIELLANRQGPLPQDRPHYIKIDGYYTFDLKKAGSITLGVRYRALSGVPKSALAGHYLYGPDESFLLPRGIIGRTDFDHGLDTHIGYARDLGRGMKMEVFGDVFNVYNRQGEASVDETYGLPFSGNSANPIVGGTYEDLIWAKALDANGNEPATPAALVRNRNFGNTAGRYAPLSVQLGARLTF